MRNQSLPKQWTRILMGLAMLSLVVPASGQSLGISELMFQPPPAVATNWPADDYEFIELFNPGSNYNLQGCYFSSGITLTFSNALVLASNRYLAIARNRTAFTNRYPLATNLASQAYSGQLANEGEKITLKNAGGVTLCTFTYAVGGDWPDRVRGQGAAMVLSSANANRDIATNWGNSDALYGTPGTSNLSALNDVVINEILPHTDPPQEDAVELRNLTAAPVSLHGWYLSDDPLNRKKYRITNAVVAANSHTVLYQYQFDATNAPLPGNVPFALSESGDQLFLTAADAASNLTRFVDYARFEASANGVSFGLHPDGTGAWVTLDSVTFGTTTPPGSLAYFRSGQGASNSAPRVGPVVFSEVMYHTPNDLAEEEFIELLNLSSNAIPLFDPEYLTNTWRLTQGVDFVFPTNRWMAPGERILVTGASNLTAFRSAYQLAASIQVLGPWTGRLNNAGETLLLYRPDTPNSNGVPFILVDRLDYGDAPPWPKAADGSGPSLERISATNDGNTAANWYAGAPGGSPGAAPAIGLFNPIFDPAQPSPGTSFTVTVYVAATSAPSQVVCVTSTGDGISTNRILRDDGLGGDLVAGDSWFSAPISNVSAGTWFYYYFNAQTAGGDSISFPPPEIRFAPSADLTLRLASAGIYAVVSPSTAWTTYSIPGIATHSNFFQLYLSDAAECFVDNLSLKDDLTGTERMSNGSFFASLSGGWAGEGNHIASSRETPATEGTNALLHLRSSGVGSSSSNAFKIILSPRLTATNEPITLSLRVRQADRIINTWSWLAIGTPPPDPYISEIMYHPAQTNDPDYDYVELFNPGTSAVVLTEGRLDGVDFNFPSNTSIGPTATLVCCVSTSHIQSAWSIANVAGNWAGNLANNNDSLRLINPYGRELDRAAYHDEFPWPVEADGLGPSLERVNPLASGEDAWNWVSSALDTNWISVIWTNTTDATTNLNLNFFLDSEGRLLLDEVSVKSLPDETELLANGRFNNTTNEWSFLGNHIGARVEPSVGFGGGSGLVMVATFSRFVDPGTDDPLIILYGDALSNTVRSAAIAVTNGGSYRIAFQARRDSLATTLTSQFGTGSNVLNLAQWGTPGRSNSAALSRTSFAITNVSAEATGASTGQPVRIAVRCAPAGTGSVFTLHYRLSDTNTYRYTDTVFIPLSMNDGGTNGDLIAGDGAYSALIPFVSSNNTLVRWHVSASLTNGLIARWPALFDPEREVGIWVSTGSPQTHLPNWQLLIDQDPVTYPVANHCTAISPDGQIFVDVIVRHRGGAPAISIPQRGLALRVRNAHSLDTFFAPNQGGINFRHRTNTSRFFYRRILNEPLAYQMQKLIGLATPRWRFICLWINGAPFITTELEDPAEAFLDGNGLALNDFLSRGGNAGVRTLAGDESLNNLNFMLYQLDTASGSNRITRVQSNVWYESVRYSMAFLALIANPDQNIYWNMMQHRRAVDGRWTQYPWDVDFSFVTNTSTFYLPHLHPYYPTPLHPSVISNNDTNGAQFANILFFPETGPDSNFTRPYRQRQQESLWRYCHTLLTAPVLNPMIDALVATVAPAYLQIGVSTNLLTNQADIVKSVITARRGFLLNEAWSDKDDSLWNPTNIYDPTRIVINEIMADPLVGGEYLELYNAATQVVDLSNWRLSANAESYAFPLGTFIGPTSYLVVADAQAALTNAFDELAPAGQMIRRYFSLPLWDWAQNWTSGAETITRIVEIPQLSLPRTNATLILRDYLSNVIDSVSYGSIPPWPVAPTGSSIELTAPTADNNNGAAWRTCAIIGTPGRINTATADSDEDGMNDAFEQRIIADAGGGITTVVEVLTGDDFDGDGASNFAEFIAGTDPVSNDFPRISLSIEQAGTSVVVRFPTVTLSGPGYDFYSDRRYDLEERTNLSAEATDWTALSGFTNFPATGADMVYSNQPAIPAGFYRGRIRLIPQR